MQDGRDVDAARTLMAGATRESLRAAVAGVDAALIVTVLGLMFSLVAYGALGHATLPFALYATTIALVVGGAATFAAGGEPGRIAGPTASGALVVGALVRELQGIAGAAGNFEAAVAGVAVVGLISGAAQLLFARLRIGSALKFVPYPVLMGFANTVALSLIVAMAPAALGHDYAGRLVELPRWFDAWRPGALVVALAGTLAGWAASRWLPRVPSAFVALVAATLVHYGMSAACGAHGACVVGPLLTLGTPGTATVPDPARAATVLGLGLAYWSAVVQAGLVLAVLNALFSLLAAAHLTLAGDAPVDGNRLLRALGVGNVASACALGLPVAIIASASRAIRDGRCRPTIAMATYLAGAAVIVGLGHRAFELLPMAAIASAVFTTSRMMFDPSSWSLLRQSRAGPAARRAASGPLAVAALVVVVGLLRGLAASLFVGALAAACLLALELRRGVVLAVDDSRTRRSRRVRSAAEIEHLDRRGEAVRIIRLGHWLYFGTADELGDLLEDQSSARWLLLDLRGVAGIDVTAARSLVHAAQRLGDRGIRLVLAGLPAGDPRRRPIDLFRGGDGSLPLTLATDLDSALEAAEDALLDERTSVPVRVPFIFPGMVADDARRLEAWMEPVTVAAGDALFRTGDAGDALYAIRHGRLSVWVAQDGVGRRRLLTFGDGGIFGELALLDRRPRSADAVADTDCTLWMITRERLEALAAADAVLHAKVLNAIALQLAQRLRDTTRLLDLG